MNRVRETVYAYVVAAVLVVAALELNLGLNRYLAATPTAPFFAAVAISSALGLGPGLLATFASALLLDYYLIPPLYQINLDLGHALRLGVFCLVAIIISGLSHSLRRATERARERAEEARRELTERERVERERAAILVREREARRQAEAAQQRLAFLADAGRQVAASLDVQATLSAVGRIAVPAMCDLCVVFVVDPEGQVRRAAVTATPDCEGVAAQLRARPPSARLGTTPIGRRLLQGERLLFVDVDETVVRAMAEDDEHAATIASLHLVSSMMLPLQVHGQVFGAISFASIGSARRFASEDLVVAEELAGRAAAALSNARLYEEAREANRVKDDFLATVSHELRTPLHAILGWARLLRSAALSAEASARALETIERNANAQAQLVSDILDVSRIVSGKLKLDMRNVQVAPLVEAALDAVRPSAHARRVEIEANISHPRLVVYGDAARLQQIVWNLLSNAIKFTPPGGRVGVEASASEGEVEIRVWDTGIGIDRAFLSHVFEPFRQADSSTTRSHGGLGLGLAIVRNLAELHAGQVTAESEGPGCGSTFVLRLPLVAGPRAVADIGRAESSGALPPAILRGLRILAVDDQPDARDLIAASLERYGAEVQTVASAREALQRVHADPPDVLIGDIGMPDEDGYALIRKLRQRPGAEGRIPAIALTAYARSDDRERALDAGFQVHLAKPIADSDLAEAVATLTGRT